MLEKIRKNFISPDPVTFYATIYNFIIALVIVVLVIFTSPLLPKQLPLFYSLPWGETQLASVTQFIILPATAVFITLVNLTISWHLHESQIVLKRVLSISSAVISLLIFVTAIKIISIFL